jgi:hypothetical protein
MGSVIAHLESETGRKCFDTFRRCLDHERASLVEYDDLERAFMLELAQKPNDSQSRFHLVLGA